MHIQQYTRLGVMAVLSFISMYLLMYAMVDTLDNVHNNINQFYMAGLMTAPMVIIEVLLMRSMYQHKTFNTLIIGVNLVALVAFFILIRQQTAVSDEQFLRSMIPHHAGAILMCNHASLRDSEIKELCESIIAGQQSEIDWMKTKLESLQR